MQQRSIGSLRVSAVGLGCNNFGGRLDQDETNRVVHAAIDEGITFFDTADIYGDAQSENFLGHALGARRDRVIIATKFGIPYEDEPGGAGAGYLRHALTRSLARLGTDFVDLYQIHAPDTATPIAETMGALGELVAEGLVRELGCSNFTPELLGEANAAGPVPFTSVQNHYSLLFREPEDGLLEMLDHDAISLLPYYPLANGLLTGKYQQGHPLPEGARLALMPAERTALWLSDALLDAVEHIRSISEACGIDMVTLAFSWLAAKDCVSSVIAGASTPEQVQANAKALITLSDDVMAALDGAGAPLWG